MISEGRIPMSDAESEALAQLLEGYDGSVTLTRRDPGDKGPLLVHTNETTYAIAPDMSGDVTATEV